MPDTTPSQSTNPARFPSALAPILAISAWMTYRVAGLPFLGETEAFGGDQMAAAWVIPLGQDALIGLTAPLVVFLLATRPRVATYALGAAWLWWGITDFVVGLVVEGIYPPTKSPFGPNTPEVMMVVWLWGNLAVECLALGLLGTPAVRGYFADPDTQQVTIPVRQSPMAGKWLWILVLAAAMGVFFKMVALGMDAAFGLIL